jgi:periplasmic divalent cation tolerance protein
MDSPLEGCLVMTTTRDAAEADRLADDLIHRGLAACVQIAAVSSHYMWEGRLERQDEKLLLIKTSLARYGQVEAYLRRSHSYSLPEIARWTMSGASPDYLQWLTDNSRGVNESAVGS